MGMGQGTDSTDSVLQFIHATPIVTVPSRTNFHVQAGVQAGQGLCALQLQTAADSKLCSSF